MTNQELIELLKAEMDGKTIQFFDREGEARWIDKESSLFDLFCDGAKYRIKPEPREFWFVRDSHESNYHRLDEPPCKPWDEVIHVMEIIE